MEERLSVLKESQETLGNKISSLQETNKKKDEEAEKIRELIVECRNNLNRIKCEAAMKRQIRQSVSSRRSKSPSWEEKDGEHLEPCGKLSNSRQFSGSPCNRSRSPCAQFKDPCGDKSALTGPYESRTDALRDQISALANAQAKSRRCIEKLGEKIDREVKMKIIQSKANDCSQYNPCECDGADFQDVQGEVPIFYFTHPGNLVLIVGIAMIAFLLKANLCSLKRGQRTKLILNMLYLGSFSFHYGIVLWMSLIRGLTLSVGLSQESFNTVDSLILPKYFSICILLSAIKFYSFLVNNCATPSAPWPLPVLAQVVIESTSFLMEIITISYIVPAIARLREATDEYSKEDDPCSPPPSYCKNVEKLSTLNRMITIINMLSVMFMGSNLYYISTKLNIG